MIRLISCMLVIFISSCGVLETDQPDYDFHVESCQWRSYDVNKFSCVKLPSCKC